jgi:hypothetical protein
VSAPEEFEVELPAAQADRKIDRQITKDPIFLITVFS